MYLRGSFKPEYNKSKSGKVLAKAPIQAAFRPIFLPKIRSPMAAPNTIWVNESNVANVCLKENENNKK